MDVEICHETHRRTVPPGTDTLEHQSERIGTPSRRTGDVDRSSRAITGRNYRNRAFIPDSHTIE
ncbi:hypothetical protein GCM10022243_20730 [Saccharothrix violaceirubra]